MNGERYNIATLADMAAIPESARGRFLAALPSILSEVAKWQDIARLEKCEWIDDYKDETTVRLHVEGKFFSEVMIETVGAA